MGETAIKLQSNSEEEEVKVSITEAVLRGPGLLITFVISAVGGALAGVGYTFAGRAIGAISSTGLLGDVFPVVFNGVAGVVIGVLCAAGQILVIAASRRHSNSVLAVVIGALLAGVIAIALILIVSGGTQPLVAIGGGIAYLVLAAIGLLVVASTRDTPA